MIVVEGCDGAGKSTLVRQLRDRYGFAVGERATKDRDLLYTVTRQDTYTALAEAIKGNNPPKIWDRLFYSEMVYAAVVGRECEFSSSEQRLVGRILYALQCPIIVCLPHWRVVRENAAKEHQMPGVIENLAQIFDDYDNNEPCCFPEETTLYYDYTTTGGSGHHTYSTFGEICSDIDAYLDYRHSREWVPVENATRN